MHLSNILNEVLSESWSWKLRNLIVHIISNGTTWDKIFKSSIICWSCSSWVCPTGIKVKHCSYIMNITLAFTYIFFLCYKWFTFKSFCQFHKGTHILAFIFSSNPPNHLQALELLNSWWVVSLFLWHFHFTIDQLIIMII